jgi:hypothetical protein
VISNVGVLFIRREQICVTRTKKMMQYRALSKNKTKETSRIEEASYTTDLPTYT